MMNIFIIIIIISGDEKKYVKGMLLLAKVDPCG